MLRDYQQRSIDMLYAWLRENTGNPCLVLPTGSGKSHIIAALCKDLLQRAPYARILMLTHVKELLEQNAEKMRQHWKNAPMGMFSASLGRKEMGEPITFGGIQSLRGKADAIGHTDIIIIDESHTVSHNDTGTYRDLINDLTAINPKMRVVGLTATPYRLGHGMITEKPAIFDDLITPVTIEELLHNGYLAPLRSKLTDHALSVEGVHKRGGEYIESELNEAMNTDVNNRTVVEEVIRLAGGRKSWLFFCSGVDHAAAVNEELLQRGIKSACIVGDTPKSQREHIINEFKAGRITALTNANVLTTGFDAPNIDLIAMLRPTMSPALYVQMAGRGMRLKEHTDHCLVLDFAGNVQRHGAITNVITPDKKPQGEGEPIVKACAACKEIVAPATKICPACGEPFPEPEKKEKPPLSRNNLDIMGVEPEEMLVKSWFCSRTVSKANGKEMLKLSYFGEAINFCVDEYILLRHDGWAGSKARELFRGLLEESGMWDEEHLKVIGDDMEKLARYLSAGNCPDVITYKQDGKFNKVISRRWYDNEERKAMMIEENLHIQLDDEIPFFF